VTTEELTTDRGVEHGPAHFEDFGFTGVAAHKKLTAPDTTFRFLIWEKTDDGGSILKGGPTRIVTRGPRKGRPTFVDKKRTTTIIVTRSEEDAARAEYERSTGYCSFCVGSGREFARWDHLTGSWFRSCQKCNGTGKVKLVQL
jgi:hypothetical protein